MISDFVGMVKSEYEFEGLDGKTYKIAPLGLREIGTFCIWTQYREYEIAKQVGVEKDHLKEIYDRCRQNPISFDSLTFLSSVATPEGAVKLFYLSLKLNHPALKESDISKLITLEEIIQITDKVYEISGLIKDKDEVEDNSDEMGESQPPKE